MVRRSLTLVTIIRRFAVFPGLTATECFSWILLNPTQWSYIPLIKSTAGSTGARPIHRPSYSERKAFGWGNRSSRSEERRVGKECSYRSERHAYSKRQAQVST